MYFFPSLNHPYNEYPDEDEAVLESTLEAATQKSQSSPAEAKMDIDSTPIRPAGRIVGIIKRNWRPYCGTIDATNIPDTVTASTLQTAFVIPMDRRIPKVRIQTRQARNLLHKRILVSVDLWSRTSRYSDYVQSHLYY